MIAILVSASVQVHLFSFIEEYSMDCRQQQMFFSEKSAFLQKNLLFSEKSAKIS